MYEGRTDVEKGKILGHENLGEVVEVGKAVDTVKKGDKVVLPFNIGCGFCANCERGLTGYCLTCADPSVMPGMAGAAYGFAGMGPYCWRPGAISPCAVRGLQLPPTPRDADEKEKDYVMLSDIFPTGWHSTRLADLKPGESIMIYGAGPVGLMAAMSARFRAQARSLSLTAKRIDSPSPRRSAQLPSTLMDGEVAIRSASSRAVWGPIAAPNASATNAITLRAKKYRTW